MSIGNTIRSAWFVALIASCLSGHAQNGTVRLLVQPWKRVSVRVDDGKPMQRVVEMRLAEGPHKLMFWSEAFTVWDTTLNIAPGKNLELRHVLRHDPEHMAYLKAHHSIWRKKATWIGVPAAMALGGGIWALANKKDHDAAYDQLHTLADSYSTNLSPSGIEVLKSVSIPAAQNEVDATRQRLTTSLVICGVGIAGTIYGIIKARKYTYPTYEDKEKARFEGAAWLPGPKGGTWAAALTIPIR